MSGAEMEGRYEHVEYRFISFMLHNCNTKQVHQKHSAHSVTGLYLHAKACHHYILCRESSLN